MTEIRHRVSDRLLRSGAALSVDRYEMERRAAADRTGADAYGDEAQVLLLTGWVSRLHLWLAQRLRPTRRVPTRPW